MVRCLTACENNRCYLSKCRSIQSILQGLEEIIRACTNASETVNRQLTAKLLRNSLRDLLLFKDLSQSQWNFIDEGENGSDLRQEGMSQSHERMHLRPAKLGGPPSQSQMEVSQDSKLTDKTRLTCELFLGNALQKATSLEEPGNQCLIHVRGNLS